MSKSLPLRAPPSRVSGRTGNRGRGKESAGGALTLTRPSATLSRGALVSTQIAGLCNLSRGVYKVP